MAKGELHSDTMRIEQKPDLVIKQRGDKPMPREDGAREVRIEDYDGDVVRADPEALEKEYLDELKFMEEPVQIMLNPSTDENAPTVYPIWVNGRKAEVWMKNSWEAAGIDETGHWYPWGYLPVGKPIVVKRKVLEVIIRAKIDKVTHDYSEVSGQNPENRLKRSTRAVHSFSILEDRNPRGGAWAAEMARRNY